jgi:hypothetical protein
MRMATTTTSFLKEVRSIADGVGLMVTVGAAILVGPGVLVGLAAGLARASQSKVIGSLSQLGR